MKSAKTYLKDSIGVLNLAYGELSTFVAEMEACMNSGHLLPVKGDPEDLNALTPGHALVGRPLKQSPDSKVSDRELK